LFGLETGRTFGGMNSRTERDSLGRVVGHKFKKSNRYVKGKSYLWGSNDKLLQVITDGKVKRFDYDGWENLSKTIFEDENVERRNPDCSGNLFSGLTAKTGSTSAAANLLKTENWRYKYDKEGNLIRKKDKRGAKWRYEWNDAGMLVKVKRPDVREFFFMYDALGRRIEKQFGNVPLHEQRFALRAGLGRSKQSGLQPKNKVSAYRLSV
jgi:YD repeat-containing protein